MTVRTDEDGTFVVRVPLKIRVNADEWVSEFYPDPPEDLLQIDIRRHVQRWALNLVKDQAPGDAVTEVWKEDT